MTDDYTVGLLYWQIGKFIGSYVYTALARRTDYVIFVVRSEKLNASALAISGAILKPHARAHGRGRMEDLPSLLNSSGAGKANA